MEFKTLGFIFVSFLVGLFGFLSFDMLVAFFRTVFVARGFCSFLLLFLLMLCTGPPAHCISTPGSRSIADLGPG